MQNRKCLAAMFAVACALTVFEAGVAYAETFPTKSIRVIVPLSAGSATDIIPRTVFEQVSTQVGQSFVIENRTGGGGTIGAGAVAKADPDGYTLLVHSNAHVIAPAVFANLPYDVTRDFAGITPLGILPHVLVIAPSKNVKTLQEFVAYAKAQAGGINYASGGTGTSPHLNGEHFGLSMGFKTQHIPFRGAPEALTEVMAGRVDIYFSPILPALPLVRDGQLLALAVTSSKRSSELPKVPTSIEAGYPNSEFGLWIGMYAPAKTPRDIVNKLNEETVKALRNPTVREKLAKLGVDEMIMSPEKFDDYVRAQVEINAKIAKGAGIVPK
jgi:tripartite-type tricarboxylate transporter receptor subunit TctC